MIYRRTLLASMPAAAAFAGAPRRGRALTEPETIGFSHTVLFRFKSDVTGPQRDTAIEGMKGLAKASGVSSVFLRKIIPPTNPERDSTGQYEYVLTVDFADQGNYAAYQASDVYKTIMSESFTPYRATMTAVDVNQPFWYVAKDPALAKSDIKFRHYVLYNFKPSVPEPLRYHINATIMGATATQPTVLGFMMGKNILPSSATSRFEWLCIADFASDADQDAYQKYPMHIDITRDVFEPNYSECIVDDAHV